MKWPPWPLPADGSIDVTQPPSGSWQLGLTLDEACGWCVLTTFNLLLSPEHATYLAGLDKDGRLTEWLEANRKAFEEFARQVTEEVPNTLGDLWPELADE